MYSLKKVNGKIYATDQNRASFSDNSLCDDRKEIPVTLAWLRPISGVGKEITLIGEDNEIGVIDDLKMLDCDSRKIAEEELEKNYFISTIKKILHTNVYLGNRYFEVLTDKGKTSFVVKNPFISIRKYGNDGLFIRDTVGNLFVIDSISAIDQKSRFEMEKVM